MMTVNDGRFQPTRQLAPQPAQGVIGVGFLEGLVCISQTGELHIAYHALSDAGWSHLAAAAGMTTEGAHDHHGHGHSH